MRCLAGMISSIHLLQSILPIRVVQLLNDSGEHNLQDAIDHSARVLLPRHHLLMKWPISQLSGGTTGTPKLIPRTHNDYYYSVRRSVEICHFTQQTRYLCAIPAAHNYAMSFAGIAGRLSCRRNGCSGGRSQRHALLSIDYKTSG